MKTPLELIDKIEDDCSKLSLEDWLELLEGLRDEIEIKIENVKHDIKNNV